MLRRDAVLALQADGLAETQPGFDAALFTLRAVVIEDALDPLAAVLAVRHVRQDGSILDGNADLVVIAVVDPPPHLLLGALAAVHGDVEGMVDVVAVFLSAQLRLELFAAPGQLLCNAHRVHNSTSIPS